MAWIESHTVLVRHRKVVDFAIILGIKPVAAIGHLHALWHSVLEQAEDGDLSQWSDKFIAAAASWDGDSEYFCKALRGCLWLDPGNLVHDWLDYAGRYLETKYKSSHPEFLRQIKEKHKVAASQPKAVPKIAIPPIQPALPKPEKKVKAKKEIVFVKDNPPSVEDVREYCASRKNGIDPQAFHDKNTSIGWLDKNKIPYRDWKAVVRIWENYRNNTTATQPTMPVKRPVAIVVFEKIAAGKSDHDILHDLVGTYTEHAINESLMHARGKIQ